MYLERGVGAHVWDVDGNDYVDFHNGFGVMCDDLVAAGYTTLVLAIVQFILK